MKKLLGIIGLTLAIGALSTSNASADPYYGHQWHGGPHRLVSREYYHGPYYYHSYYHPYYNYVEPVAPVYYAPPPPPVYYAPAPVLGVNVRL